MVFAFLYLHWWTIEHWYLTLTPEYRHISFLKDVLNLKMKWKVPVNHARINKDLNSALYIFGPNSEILNWISGESSCGHAQNGTFKLNFTFHPYLPKQQVFAALVQIDDPSLNGCWFTPRISLELTHTRTHTHTYGQTETGNDDTRRPKLASG